jgi:hypothetical protein
MLYGFGVVDEVVVDGGCTPRCPPLSGFAVGFGVLEGRGGYVCVDRGVVVVDVELTVVGLLVC